MQMYWMQYSRVSVPAWTVAEPVLTLGYREAGSPAWPSYWVATQYDQNYTDDAQNIFTLLH
ncbi:MAG TPA: hypothetical protein VFX65_11990 [Candidatus Limnocylindrales bacterium]|nr:hypothetical protein [Candidatus Limnocylindrales bacterium]